MSRISRFVVSTAFSFAAIFGTSIAAGAHGAPLPIGHIGLTHLGRLPFTVHDSAHIATPFPGAGSLTSRINGYNIKNVVTAGFAGGQNYALNQTIGGAVSSGFLTGPIYSSFGGPYNNIGQNFSFAIGSNPYNVGLGPGAPITAPPGVNSISFANVGGFKHGGGGGGGIFSTAAFGKGGTFGTSGAARAQSAFYKTLTGSSALAGEKSIQSLGPLTGGQLYGSLFNTGGGHLNINSLVVVPFGNNPFNSNTIPTFTGSFTNYLIFGNTTRMVTGGQLTFTLYEPGFNFGRLGIAFGNSPFNKGLTGGPYPFTSFKDIINLAALAKFGHH